MLERVEQFAALRLGARDGGFILREVADLLRREQSFGDHAVHERADSGISPLGAFEEFFLNGWRGARFVFPDGFDDRPFGFGQFDFQLWHKGADGTTASLLYNCKAVKQNIYKCKDRGLSK